MKRFNLAAILLLLVGMAAGYGSGRLHGERMMYREASTVALTAQLEKIAIYLGAIQLTESGESVRVLSLLEGQLSASVSAAFNLSNNPIDEPFSYPNLIEASKRAQQFYAGREGSELLEERARIVHERLTKPK